MSVICDLVAKLNKLALSLSDSVFWNRLKGIVIVCVTCIFASSLTAGYVPGLISGEGAVLGPVPIEDGTAGDNVLGPVSVEDIANSIRNEATLPNNSEIGYPLPLAAHWNTGYWYHFDAFTPNYQMKMIMEGHYLLPWFMLTSPYETELNYNDVAYLFPLYYETAIKKAAELKLPISFLSTQWEIYLTISPEYFSLPPQSNPNVVTNTGQVLQKVSPFGPMEPWHELGKKWTQDQFVGKLQELYPDPPLVLFVSNNEHAKLTWNEVEQDYRYLSAYGSGRDDNFKRKVVGDGWIKLYRALENGMRDGLGASNWKAQSVFVGYDAFGTSAFGRWDGWINYSLYTPGRMEPWPLAWDGASPSYYVNNWNPSTDFKVWSPQIESMNWVFMLDDARRINPDFRFEMSTWDGHWEDDTDKRKYYADLGQVYDPIRYEGFIQFGMWLLRPRIVREFRLHTDTLLDAEPYFLSIVRSVDRVHNNQVLRKFWRKGKLVANNNHQHPYQSNIPEEYRASERWFLLDTNLDPARPWALDTEIPVFSLALVLGTSPEREWLIYAHSPLKERDNVKITVPDYGSITVNVRQSGSFYYILENGNAIGKIPSPPTSLTIN